MKYEEHEKEYEEEQAKKLEVEFYEAYREYLDTKRAEFYEAYQEYLDTKRAEFYEGEI